MRKIVRLLLILAVLPAILAIPLTGLSFEESPAPLDVRGFSAAPAPSGELWAVWSADGGHDTDVLYSRRTGTGWQPAQPVYSNPATWDDMPSLAFAADGTPWVAWSSASQHSASLLVSRWTGRRWSPPEQVPAELASRPHQPTLAAAPGGGLWLAWVGFDGNDDEIYASFWDGETWSTPTRVGQDDADPLAYDTHPRLAVDAEGRAWLIWVSSEGLLDDVVVSSHWDGIAWSPEQAVSAPDNTPDVWPSLALDASGQPWVAWQDLLGLGADARWRIYVARWQAGSWKTEEMVSSPGGLPLDEAQPSLRIDADGTPHLVWAVSGKIAGVAYATWDGTTWTESAWAVQEAAAEAPHLLATEPPSLLWSELASSTVPLVTRQLDSSRDPLPRTLPLSESAPLADCIYNRYVGWGDSITWGQYDDPPDSGIPVGDYPQRLEGKLDTRVIASEVINRGIPSEKVAMLRQRIGNEAATYRPQFPLIMEGTNDVTHGHPPSEVAEDLHIILDILKKYLDIDGMRPWLSTLPPRLDGFNPQTQTMNSYIIGVADSRSTPWTDTWQAFMDYGDWGSLFQDNLHPNSTGMQVLADNWYMSVLNRYSWLYEETTPPTTWIEPLPAESQCGEALVQWSGTDNLSWVVNYDVQYQVNAGPWTDWFLAIEETNGTYYSTTFGNTIGFRVRGRDVVGNQNDYSAAAYTTISDDGPPQDVQVFDLPPAQTAPFSVLWWATDLCSPVTAFDVEYRVGISGTWQSWLSSTPNNNATFDPAPPQYGETYYFQTRARDLAGNWSPWSAPASTKLARFALKGDIVTTRHEPVLWAEVSAPDAMAVVERYGGYTAYLLDEGDYEVSASRTGFGLLPPMHVLSVTADMEGLDFVLPPLDDVVSDGGFEAGAWGDWLPGGSLTPTLTTLTTQSHTGDGAVLLGDEGKTSSLSQSLSIPGDLTNATLSFLVRLDDDADGSSTLQVELAGTDISHTQIVPAGGWTHVWLPVDAALGDTVTLSFSVSDDPALRLDEVSLGSALYGGSQIGLPVILRD